MPAVFAIDHEELARDPRFAGLAAQLSHLSPIDSRAAFNRYGREACRLWQTEFPHGLGTVGADFPARAAEVERGGPQIIRTGWGGVVVTRHEPPEVEKFLVVQRAGYLALEMHAEKEEQLEVREGAGLILWRRQAQDRALTAQVLQPGRRFHFRPGIEHCLIGTEDLLVFERSSDPKGMDQDLIFLYEPEPV